MDCTTIMEQFVDLRTEGASESGPTWMTPGHASAVWKSDHIPHNLHNYHTINSNTCSHVMFGISAVAAIWMP